ncbi:hypothetical protein ASA1KI_30270 [Opitutales bacterium ASA1]|uniref:PulJ/GspJ family protein n=1 Tax=Congregicoccus parvus TaxID=3081749 RepID=UPI002B317F91|nr:hypothetical protein ASA1KI_30270 [Opitutales bacterium ASA1]
MNTRRNAGFSLPEILTVMGVVGLLTSGVMGFFIQSLKSGNASEQQVELLSSMRSFMNEMVYNASRAHELVLYDSTAATARTAAGRREVLNSENETESDDVCPTGNFAVFVYYELPKPANQAKYRIREVIGYYLDTIDSGPPALTRMTIDLTASPSSDTVEEILTAHWATADRKTIAPRIVPLALSDGFVESTVPQLFYKRASQNMAVCGQLRQSSAKVDTADGRTQTRTFYFSVTVRS